MTLRKWLYTVYWTLLSALLVGVLAAGGCIGTTERAKRQQFARGKMLYKTHCQRCHKADGKGFQQLYPPLAGVDYLERHEQKIPCIIKKGMKGPVKVAGKEYNLPMPGNQELTAHEIAQLITYLYNAWGQEHPKFEPEMVQKALNRCDSVVRVE